MLHHSEYLLRCQMNHDYSILFQIFLQNHLSDLTFRREFVSMGVRISEKKMNEDMKKKSKNKKM
jgi:hypothetical protein